ncbi:MAG: 3'-5' exonuclease, partial [Anaerococcus sp.]|nr:3'-5' exonuclease [Anaerococcus sp.]
MEMDKFIDGFQNTKNISLSEVLYKSFNLPILKDILKEKLDTLKNQKALNNIAIFTQKVSEYEELFDKKNKNYYIEFIYGYLFYLYKTKAIKEAEDLPEENEAINFMTIHNAKGLEFDVVFVSGLNDYPRADKKTFLSDFEKISTDDGAERDFYRKYYTAFTRAKKLLVILDNSRDYR